MKAGWPGVFILTVIFAGVFYCYIKGKSPENIARAKNNELTLNQQQTERNKKNGEALGKLMEYFIDTRPNPPQCFGYLWRGGIEGGPGLVNVPCEAVKDLIKNGVSQKSW